MYRYRLLNDAVVEAHSCVNTDSDVSLDEQYTTVDEYSIAGRFKLTQSSLSAIIF